MKEHRLGSAGPSVSAIGFGCLSLSSSYGTGVSLDQAARVVRRAMELGITLFDTADMYGAGENEMFLGQALGGDRRRVVVATKFGAITDAAGRPVAINGRPDYVVRACEASLRRLGTDVIDIYYLHRIDKSVPIEETVGAMAELAAAGKIRHLGLCEVSAETIRRAHRVHPIAALQSEYSLWTRDVENTVLPTCRELGIGFVAFSPLGRGFLTGAIDDPEKFAPSDPRRMIPRFQGDNFRANRQLLDALRDLAEARRRSPAQIALAWLVARGNDIVPIPGTKRCELLEENRGAADLELDSEELHRLNTVFAVGRVSGERYGEAARRFVDD